MRARFASFGLVAVAVVLSVEPAIGRAQDADAGTGAVAPDAPESTTPESTTPESTTPTTSTTGPQTTTGPQAPPTPRATTSTAPRATTSSAPRETATTTHTVSQTGGSTATITRGDAARRPRASAAAADGDEPALPVNEEDDGRKADFLWIEVEGGVSYVDLVAMQQTNFSGTTLTGPTFEEVTGIGPMVGVGLGFRVFFLAIGARATLASYPGFEIGTVGGEVQFRLPTPIVEPWIRVGAGYAWQGSANYRDPMASLDDTTVYGWTVNAALGLDVFVTWWFSLGIGVTADFLNMTRQVDVTQPCMDVTEFCPTEPGDAIGAQGRAFLQAGLHF